MAYVWIKAPLALQYVAGNQDVGSHDAYRARPPICERAQSGLIASRAEVLKWGRREEINCRIPEKFWWAGSHEALSQDWRSGDFSTWIDSATEVKAFGVSFDYLAISELVSADQQSASLRRISVLAKDDWISARALFHLLGGDDDPEKVSAKMEEACRLGQISGRAMRASREKVDEAEGKPVLIEGFIEWDIPLSFWQGLSGAGQNSPDWQSGELEAQQGGADSSERLRLQGVYFHRSGLPNLGLEPTQSVGVPSADSARGRKPVYDWVKATNAVWGRIYRGDLNPQTQAQIESQLQALLSRGDSEPSPSTVRPYAKKIWNEIKKDDNSG